MKEYRSEFIPRRKPAPECAACGAGLDEVGGKRVLTSYYAPVVVVVTSKSRVLPLHPDERVISVCRDGEPFCLHVRV